MLWMTSVLRSCLNDLPPGIDQTCLYTFALFWPARMLLFFDRFCLERTPKDYWPNLLVYTFSLSWPPASNCAEGIFHLKDRISGSVSFPASFLDVGVVLPEFCSFSWHNKRLYHFCQWAGLLFLPRTSLLVVPPRIPIVELFLAKGTIIFGFSSVYFHVVFHLLLPCKWFITCRTFVGFLVQVNSLDVLI